MVAVFYWIDVRWPYNIEQYEAAGLNYELFAVSCIVVVLFAGGRLAAGFWSVSGSGESMVYKRFHMMTIIGLLGQLVLLVIHFTTTKRMSRTAVAALIGSLLSGIIQVNFTR